MSARDDYPRLAAFAEPGSINGKPHQTETGNEFARALDEIDRLRSKLWAISKLDDRGCNIDRAIELARGALGNG